jgi:hypothetical protein
MATPKLAKFLEDEITNQLKNLTHADVKKDVVESLTNPTGAAATTARATAQTKANDFVQKVATKLPAHKPFPWIQPDVAALAASTIYLACLQCWVAAGTPPTAGGGMHASVKEFIRWQAAAFAAAVGADRTP